MASTVKSVIEIDYPSCEEVIILDFETTGLSPYYDRVIEVAAIVVKNNKLTDTFTQLMNPSRYIPYFITELTGITNNMVKDQPSPEKVMPKLKQFIGNRLILAHNATFDKKFLIAEMERVNLTIDNHMLCTMILARKLIQDAYNHKLTTLAYHLNIKATKAHRALSDVEVTAKLWGHLYTKVSVKSGIKKPEVPIFMAISKKPKSVIDKYFEKINNSNLTQ